MGAGDLLIAERNLQKKRGKCAGDVEKCTIRKEYARRRGSGATILRASTKWWERQASIFVTPRKRYDRRRILILSNF